MVGDSGTAARTGEQPETATTYTTKGGRRLQRLEWVRTLALHRGTSATLKYSMLSEASSTGTALGRMQEKMRMQFSACRSAPSWRYFDTKACDMPRAAPAARRALKRAKAYCRSYVHRTRSCRRTTPRPAAKPRSGRCSRAPRRCCGLNGAQPAHVLAQADDVALWAVHAVAAGAAAGAARPDQRRRIRVALARGRQGAASGVGAANAFGGARMRSVNRALGRQEMGQSGDGTVRRRWVRRKSKALGAGGGAGSEEPWHATCEENTHSRQQGRPQHCPAPRGEEGQGETQSPQWAAPAADADVLALTRLAERVIAPHIWLQVAP